jgi:flagellar motility protein MotE (MotC chaperone)
MSRIRLLPVLVFGMTSLVAIKLLTLALAPPVTTVRQEATLAERVARSVQLAREGASDEEIITGSTPKKKEGEGEAAPKKDETKAAPLTEAEKIELEKAKAAFKVKAEAEGVRIPLDSQLRPNRPSSLEERALLEKLKDRRDEIETRDRELEMRDNLLRVGERKLDERIGELRSLESQSGQNKNKPDAKERYKPLVVMYENMKPKEAARVFDRLETGVLLDVVDHMNPRKVSEILAVMDTKAAERLTVAMARRAAAGDAQVAEAARAAEDVELPRLPAAPRR